MASSKEARRQGRVAEFLQQLEVLVPATLIEAFAQGVGSVAPETLPSWSPQSRQKSQAPGG